MHNSGRTPILHGHARIALTVLPHVNAKDGLTSRVVGANHEGVVLVWRGLNGERAVLGNRQPGPACMQMSQLWMCQQLYMAAGRQAGSRSHHILMNCDII